MINQNKFIKKVQWLKLGIVAVCLLFSSAIFAQQISGTVTNEATGEALIGASILIEGTNTGVTTDIDGKFTLDAKAGDILQVSYTGYTTERISIGTENTVNITLREGVITEEIVVTGYTTQRKRDITGAVSVVSSTELNEIQATSFSQKLEGRASGLTTSTSGEPGEGTNVRIRGIGSFSNNDPLYIIDGVPTTDVYNTGFNSNDIETIQVLKDASAASIYGARANNGVIIITTKKGKAGKVSVTYDGYIGMSNPVKTQSDYMITDPLDYSTIVWDAHENAGVAVDSGFPYAEGRGALPNYSYPYKLGSPDADPADYSFPDNLIFQANKAGTDWADEVFNTALITEHNLGIGGGSDAGRFYISTSYLDQQGTMINTYFKRFTVRANSEFKKGIFTFGENITFSRSNSVGQDAVSGGNQDEQGVMTWITLMNPLTPVYDVSGVNFAGDKATGMSNGSNPVAMLTRNKDNEGTYYRMLGNIFMDIEIVSGLKFRTSLGSEFWNNYIGAFAYPSYENREANTTNGFSENWGHGFNWTWTNTLVYTKTFSEVHDITALLGYEALKSQYRNFGGSLADYFSDDINGWYLNTGLANPNSRQVNTNGGYSTIASMFAKVDYSYADKYLVSATIRRDGSSNFGDEKYGVFPAFSVGWRISGESFMQNTSWLEDLKLRFGWGITGNQRVPGGNAFDRFGGGPGSTFYDITGSNNGVATGYALTNRGNKSTKWEENVSTNIGIDASFMDGKLNVVLDLYNRTVDGLLFPAKLPGTSGTAAPAYVNIGSMENKGLDLSVDYQTRVSKDFNWGLGLVFSTYKNEIISIDGSSESFFPTGFDSRIGTININQLGSSISSFYGWTADGIFTSQGEVDSHAAQDGKAVGRIRFKDLNGDNVINDEDKGVIGDPHPDFTGGLTISFGYKKFDLNIFLFGSVGNEIFNYNKLFDTFRQFNSNVRTDLLTDSFHPTDNPTGSLPMLDVNDVYSRQPSSFYVEDASYLRAKSIQLGYTFDVSGDLGKVFERLRLYIQGQNVFTITGYSGVDPAISNFGVQDSDPNNVGSVINGDLWNGYDFGSYPNNKIFSFGVNATF